MKMKAAVMTGVGKPLEIREVELDPPKTGEVLVRILATAVCHSDLNTLNDPTTPVPQILGHEGAGEVVAVGDNVTTCQVGDRVVLSWLPYCGTCPVINLALDGDIFSNRPKNYRCKVYMGMMKALFKILQRSDPEEIQILNSWIDDDNNCEEVQQ